MIRSVGKVFHSTVTDSQTNVGTSSENGALDTFVIAKNYKVQVINFIKYCMGIKYMSEYIK